MTLQATQTQLVAPGASTVSSIISDPDLTNDLTWRLINDADGTIAIADSPSGIVEIDYGDDGRRRYDRPFTAPGTVGRYLAIWTFASSEQTHQMIVVEGSPNAAFASALDVAARLGRDLTEAETYNSIPFLLNMAAAEIANAAGYDDGWVASLSPVPQMLRKMSVELVCRALPNPSGYSSIRQQVGSYSIAVTQDTPGMALTDAEVLAIRRAVHGRTTESVHIDSSFERAQDEYWLRKQARALFDPEGTIA